MLGGILNRELLEFPGKVVDEWLILVLLGPFSVADSCVADDGDCHSIAQAGEGDFTARCRELPVRWGDTPWGPSPGMSPRQLPTSMP